jgi:threonine/homoserine/homoserine lactone efflux protein
MFEYILVGSGFAFAAAVQPGPLQAFLFTSVTQKGWKKTLPASFSPLLSDGPIAILVLLVLNGLPQIIKPLLQSAGGIFLLFIAYRTFIQWKRSEEVNNNLSISAPKTILQAALVNILNPNPYIGWSLVLGPAFLNAWQKNHLFGVSLLASFYFTMVVSLMSIIILFGTSGMLNDKQRKILSLASILILALIGMYQFTAGIILIA